MPAEFAKVASKNLPVGSWVLIATVNARSIDNTTGDDHLSNVKCELRSGADVVGYTEDRRVIPGYQEVDRSLTLNAGAQIAAGGGEVSLWCNSNGGDQVVDSIEDSKLMMLQVGGFS